MARAVEAYNHPVRKVYGGYDTWFLRPFVHVATAILMNRNATSSEYTEYRKNLDRAVSRSRYFVGFFRKLLLAEYLLEIFVKVTLPLWRGQIVVSDRYVFDTAVNVADNLHLSFDEHLDLTTKWLKFFPRPDLVVWVVAPPHVCIERKDDIPSLDYVLKRMSYYEHLPQRFDLEKLDGTAPLEEIERWAEHVAGQMIMETDGAGL